MERKKKGWRGKEEADNWQGRKRSFSFIYKLRIPEFQ
jgi:hypothetical protein